MPPRGGPAIPAARIRASFWESAIGTCSDGTMCATADVSAAEKATNIEPSTNATTISCGTVSIPATSATTTESSASARTESQTIIIRRRLWRSARAPAGSCRSR